MRRRTLKINPIFLFIVYIMFFGACNKDDRASSPLTESQIIASPDAIMINDDETRTLYLTVQPRNEFQWNVSSKPDWIDIDPLSGTINDKIIKLQLTPNSTGLIEGKHFGEIEIITNGAGKVKSTVDLCVNAHPIARLDQHEILFLENESETTIVVSNAGTGFLYWKFDSLPSWMSVNIQEGILDGGEKIDVIASVQRKGLAVGSLTAKAVLTSNSEEGNIDLNLILQVPPMAIMSISKPSLNFGFFEDNQSFFVKNEGNITFDWDWDDNSNSFLSIHPDVGTLAVGDSVAVNMSVNRSDLLSQVYNLEVFINNNVGQSLTLPVQIQHFKERKLLIDGRVVDAEYDRKNDVIVVVSEDPYEIRKFDAQNGSVESLKLNISPTCVSVGHNGNFAVVGHNGSFTYVDLRTMEIEGHYSITTDAYDIVLAPNDWVYIFPRGGQWENIRCVYLATGEEKLHTGGSIYDKTKAKLHPSGNFIYGANNGLSPSDFEKYDVSRGAAQYLYDSPYHGDFAFDGDLWISEDGNRLFAKSRNVFNASSNRDNDMTYNGQLVGQGLIQTLDYSAKAEKIYTIFTTENSWNEIPDNKIRKYESEFLAFQGTIELPGFLIPDGNGGGTMYDSQGHYGFFNSFGTLFFVLVKVEEGAGAQDEWAIVTVEVE